MKNDNIKWPYELFGVECGKGWYKLLDPIFEYIEKYNKNKAEEEKIHVEQIKEKFSTLRVYTNFTTPELEELIDKAEDKSAETCEICGSTKDIGTTEGGWMTTECHDCVKKWTTSKNAYEKWRRHSDNKLYYISPTNNKDIEMNTIYKGHNYANLYNADCVDIMSIPSFKDKFQLTVTSPPYDNLRSYNDDFEWNFGKFKKIANLLYYVTKPGGVVVWVVGDATIKRSETGTSFKQALYFKEIGFNLHDTMIYQKANPIPQNHNRYEQCFEYMFVFSKGKPSVFNPIRIPTLNAGKVMEWGNRKTVMDVKQCRRDRKNEKLITNPTKMHNNIFTYSIGGGKTGHPAVFPYQLAKDHIMSWSNENDIVFDPFMGSCTTGLAALDCHRNFYGSEISSQYYNISVKRLKDNIDVSQENKG